MKVSSGGMMIAYEKSLALFFYIKAFTVVTI
jgi:hypothetical protein